MIDLLQVAKTSWTSFYTMTQLKIFTVKGVEISIWDCMLFLAASEVIIWFLKAMFAGDKGTGGGDD